MTKNLNPSKLSEVFVLTILQVIRIHWNFSDWEVLAVCHPRRGMRIFVLLIRQVIRMMKWEVVVLVRHPRRGLKLLKDIDILTNYGIKVINTLAMIPTNLPRALAVF